MADRTINVQYKLRGDALANLEAKNAVYADREPIIVIAPTGSDGGMNTILLKIGDGVTTFNDLPYVTALAGDVAEWAKAATKPIYTADEIEGLSGYIADEIDDTDTQYKIEQDNDDKHVLKFYSQEKGATEWTLKATITTADTVYDDTDLAGRVTDTEGEIGDLKDLVGNEDVATQIANAIAALSSIYDAKGSAAAILGSDEDVAGDNTVYGANKAAAVAKTVADEKVAGVTAGDNSVEVVNTDPKNPEVKVKIDPDEDNALQLGENGLKVVVPDAAVIEVIKKATANDGYIATYQVTVDGTAVGADINIPKDYLVKSAEIKVVTTADDPYTGAAVGNKYIDFVVNTVDGTDNESHIYLSVQDLVDEYTAGDGIDISDTNVISIKLGTDANGLKVGANGLELDEATTTSAGAMSAADKIKVDGVSDGATKVEASDTNGNVKIDGTETEVYKLPDTVLDSGDTFVFDGGNA